MNQKTNYFALLFITILASSISYFLIQKTCSLEKVLSTSEQVQEPDIGLLKYASEDSIPVEHIEKKPTWYKTISIDYPIGNAPGLVYEKLLIDRMVTDLECSGDVENPNETESTLGLYDCELSINYSHTATKKFLTHVLQIGNSDSSARMFFDVHTLTLNQDNKIISYQDLFKKDTFQEELLKILATNLKKELGPDVGYDIDEFEDNKEEVLKYLKIGLPFKMTSQGITFILTESQFLPHRAGIIEVLIPYSALADIIKPEFLPN